MSLYCMARFRRLSLLELELAETHGKRADEKSQARVVRDAPPITWFPDGVECDPLALRELYHKHVDGAFIPKGKGRVLHLLVKFPESVPVEAEGDAKLALQLAVDFAQQLFGGRAVFAARMDRDEKSFTNADIFLAPRYTKQTKHTSKTAISLSRHLKEMTARRGVLKDDRDILRSQGQALQDEFAEYLRSRGYQALRGQPKTTRSPDWGTPELYAADNDRRLAAIDREAAKDLYHQAELEHAAAQQIQADTEDRVAEQDRQLDARWTELGRDRDKLQQDAQKLYDNAVDEERIRVDAEADADHIRNKANADATQILAAARQVEQDAQAGRQQALIDAAAIKVSAEKEAAAILESAKREQAAAINAMQRARVQIADAAEKERVAAYARTSAEQLVTENEFACEQLALLTRAMHDYTLHLVADDCERGFRMDEAVMNAAEKTAYRAHWIDALRQLAIRIAARLKASIEHAMRFRKERQRLALDQAVLEKRQSQIDTDRTRVDIALKHAQEFRDAFDAIPPSERTSTVARALHKGSVLEQAEGARRSTIIRSKKPEDQNPSDLRPSRDQDQSR